MTSFRSLHEAVLARCYHRPAGESRDLEDPRPSDGQPVDALLASATLLRNIRGGTDEAKYHDDAYVDRPHGFQSRLVERGGAIPPLANLSVVKARDFLVDS